MPYAKNSELPTSVSSKIPSGKAKTMFRRVVNAQLKRGVSEAVAFASAWSALKNAGYNKNDQGQWVKKSLPSLSDVHVPTTERKKPAKKEGYKAPAAAANNAKRALRWKEKYGDEVKGGTAVGWTRARQLANGETLSRSTVGRMASFNRHRKNSSVDPKYKDEPWKDAGHVAWLLWGGDAGVDWAMNTIKKSIAKRYLLDDRFTTTQEAEMRSLELGMDGAIHVHDGDGVASYMPGATHEDYLNRLSQDIVYGEETKYMGDEEYEGEYEEVQEDLLEVLLRAIFDRVIGKSQMLETFEKSMKFLKRDDERRVVWGWASVISENGEPVVDSQGDIIDPEEMNKMADDFMLNVRAGKSMHMGEDVGVFVHSLPLTKELADAFGFKDVNREGWIVGMKVLDDDVWDDIKSGAYGELPSFSIGGKGERHAAQ